MLDLSYETDCHTKFRQEESMLGFGKGKKDDQP